MISMKRAAQTGCLASYALLTAACNSTDPSATESRTHQLEGKGAEILYSETFADSGRFSITKDPEGRFGYDVQARIGSDAEKLLAASSTQLTLADVYRALHEGREEIPAVVAEVSEKLGTRQPTAADGDRPAAPAQALGKSASLSDFAAGYCRDIREGSYTWRWLGCFWLANDHYIVTPWVNSDGNIPDRVYAWNRTPYTATLSLWNKSGTSQPNTWRPTLQPYWVTWFQWGGVYSDAYAYMELPAGKTGELGIVAHYAVPYVR
jgi:hypothetical protein